MKPVKKAALKVLELDDQLAEVYESLAGVSGYLEWNWESAKREIKRVIELKPGYAWAYFHLSNFLLWQARFDDAIKALQKALELWKDADPGIAEAEDARKRVAGF